MAERAEDIRAYWDQQAREFGEDSLATIPDSILKELEIKAISARLRNEGILLDVGCGNGYSTLQFARERVGPTLGVDYSREMISVATVAVSRAPGLDPSLVRFQVGDVLSLPFAAESIDDVTSDRCLINLVSYDDQERAITEVARVLKSGGRYLMCEDTQQGLSKLNELRRLVDLPEITNRWHNLYLDEREILVFCESLFDIEEVDNFSSTYYLASRIFNGKLADMDGQEPRYDHPINRIAARLPAVGDYGPLKLFIMRKR